MNLTDQQLAELDALLAGKAMGWEKCPALSRMGSERGEFYVRQDGGVYIPVRGNTIELWSPTRNKADALDVLEKCGKKTGRVILIRNLREKWAVGQDGTPFSASTIELAICLFAKELFTPAK